LETIMGIYGALSTVAGLLTLVLIL